MGLGVDNPVESRGIDNTDNTSNENNGPASNISTPEDKLFVR